MWLAQSLATNLSHFKLDVVSDKGRSFMAGFDGTAELRISANKDEGGGKLVAHMSAGMAELCLMNILNQQHYVPIINHR